MAEHPFRKAISKTLFPILRAEGFQGSGTTLRRIVGPLIHVFNVQGSTGGGCCYLNLGAHLQFLKNAPGGGSAPEKTMEYECAFRDRIEPPSRQGWPYVERAEEIAENVSLIVNQWTAQGRPFFSRYGSFPESFQRLVETCDPNAVHPIEILTIARIAKNLGDRDGAASLARAALTHVPQQATALREDLLVICE